MESCGLYHYFRISKLVQFVQKSIWWVPAGERTKLVQRAANGFRSHDVEISAQRPKNVPGDAYI